MPASPTRGDVLIRVYGGSNYQLLDAMTHEQIAIIADLQMAVRAGSEHGGAVWRENVDNRGRSLGSPVLLLPRRSTGTASA